MTRKETLKNMRKVLLQRRQALRSALLGEQSMLQDLAQEVSGDVVDMALDTAADELNSQLAEVESRELAQIENALRMIEKGQYGQCEACSNNIPLKRLQALPYATMCIGCQRESEESGYHAAAGGSWNDMRTSDVDYNVS